MRIAARFLLVSSLAIPVFSARADKLQDALAALASKDPATYDKASSFIIKHSRDAEPALRRLFQDSGQPPLVRLRAAKFLGDLADRDAIDDLKKALFSGSESNVAVRVEIIRSLSKLGSSDIILDYFDAGKETSPTANAAIAMALQVRTDEKSKEALSRLLRSDDRRVFRAAAFAVSKTYAGKNGSADKSVPTPGDRAVFEALKLKEKDKDSEVSQTAGILLKSLSEAYKEF